MELMSLPTEIHYHLQKFLDHPSLLNLSATNKYFESLCPQTKVKGSLLCLERSSLETHTILTRKGLLPCYVCLKGLNSLDHFPLINYNDEDKLGSKNEGSRACATCLITTRPDCIYTFKYGVKQDSDWLFSSGHNPGNGKCELYSSKYGRQESQSYWWLACVKCNLVKRYQSSPHGRRRRYDEALLEGDMCATCYQPVWDQEDVERRLRKNERARERYKEKKKLAQMIKEAVDVEEEEDKPTFGWEQQILGMVMADTAPMPMSGAPMLMSTPMPTFAPMPISTPMQMTVPNMFFPAPYTNTPMPNPADASGFMDEFDDMISGRRSFLFDDDLLVGRY